MDYEQLAQRIEAVLFASAKPCTVAFLADILHESEDAVLGALAVLRDRGSARGIVLVEAAGEWELATSPRFSDDVRAVHEVSLGDLSKPAIETLTIIAYRGPVRQRDIEAIRGVQCSLILRNLSLRNLIQVSGEGEGALYTVTTEMLRLFGLSSVTDLPEYERFHLDTRIDLLLERIFAPTV